MDYTVFKTYVITLFGRLEFEDLYRQQLYELAQTGFKSVVFYKARTIDLSFHAYPSFSTELQLDLADEHFVFGLLDAATRDYLRC